MCEGRTIHYEAKKMAPRHSLRAIGANCERQMRQVRQKRLRHRGGGVLRGIP